ncbi:YbaB/EbfC family DNA-binding protein [Nocardia yunnanensis]|uniref:YbaB/EbfC family DNA-binding protein n=2 Tax=Nocardia yunnanensis TaxID=2382165 RepID=A0A386ZNS9_9NOCA|nr:YbaB/EbfC family DNA-binding protein [Nocardia yunnanensis]
MREIAEASQQRAQLMASGTAASGRVTVTVNADGIVIATRFSPDVAELTPEELAKAVTSAAQQAAQDVAKQSRELLQPLRDRRATMPKLSELIEGMPDLQRHAPLDPPAASLAPPNSRERLARFTEPAPQFSNAVDYDDWDSGRRNQGATDSSW